MRYLGGVIIFALVLGGFLADAPVTSARTVSASGKITIRAVVLPARYITVDSQGNIIEIATNTTQDVAPRVYVGSISKGKERSLTPEIYEQYRQLVPAGESQVGVLYRQTVFLAEGGTILPNLLPKNVL